MRRDILVNGLLRELVIHNCNLLGGAPVLRSVSSLVICTLVIVNGFVRPLTLTICLVVRDR